MAKILLLMLLPALTFGAEKARNVQRKAISESDCETADYRAELSPVSQQGSTNWCFAYTAATLASFKLRTPVSAADIAVNYTDTAENENKRARKPSGEQEFNFLGGTADEALRRSSVDGFCRENDFSSENRENGIREYENDLQREIDFREKKAGAGITHDPHCEALTGISADVFPSLNLYDEIVARQNASRTDVIRKLRKVACRDRLRPQPAFDIADDRCDDIKTCLMGHEAYQKKLIGTIDEQLSKGNIAAISFSPIAYRTYAPGRHAATIVGRKLDASGECRYVVRDSDSSKLCPLIVAAEDEGRAQPGHPICANGHIELRRQDLQKFILGVTYLR